MKHQTVSATEFKAKCLALLDEVGRTGGTVTVTKRGRPVASVGPAVLPARRSPAGAWAGKVDIPDDLLMADTSDLWECVRERPRKRK